MTILNYQQGRQIAMIGYILPHPPIIVPGVNKSEASARKTIGSMNAIGEEIALFKPDTVIIISPHAPLFRDYIFMYESPELTGDLSRFGAGNIRLSFRQDTDLLKVIKQKFKASGIPGGTMDDADMRRNGISRDLDHGVMVPLYFLSGKYSDFNLIAMSCSGLPAAQLYKAGVMLAQASAEAGGHIAVVASGDLSHKVNDESPYGSVPEGAIFDRLFTESVAGGDFKKLLSIDPGLREKAAECGYNSAVILSGVFDGKAVNTKILSYEAPYGIGYCVASIKINERQV
jgi:aromatic ring-opening dioxygenase LigB subunit